MISPPLITREWGTCGPVRSFAVTLPRRPQERLEAQHISSRLISKPVILLWSAIGVINIQVALGRRKGSPALNTTWMRHLHTLPGSPGQWHISALQDQPSLCVGFHSLCVFCPVNSTTQNPLAGLKPGLVYIRGPELGSPPPSNSLRTCVEHAGSRHGDRSLHCRT